MQRIVNLLLCSAFFIFLQVIKPTIFMEIYRFAFNFNPTLYSNWELYKMVWPYVQASSIAMKVAIPLLVAEALWLVVPFKAYTYLSWNKKYKN